MSAVASDTSSITAATRLSAFTCSVILSQRGLATVGDSKRIWSAIVAGVLVSGALTMLGYIASKAGAHTLASVLLWPCVLMGVLFPPPNFGTPERPFYEITPVQLIAFFVGVALQPPIYSGCAYLILSIRHHRWRVGRSGTRSSG